MKVDHPDVLLNIYLQQWCSVTCQMRLAITKTLTVIYDDVISYKVMIMPWVYRIINYKIVLRCFILLVLEL